ncbi:MAG: hypothetical protein NTW49_03250 [Bacteroidia bacterium]|nr:hypothetical protein [Bacteroidia bacterium]
MKCIILFASVLLFTSCDVMFHYPSSPNIPILDSTKVFSTEGCLTSIGLDAKANFRFPKNIVLQGTLHKLGNEFYKEAAIGYAPEMTDIKLSIIGGFGVGSTDFGNENEGSDYAFFGHGRYTKYFGQATFTFGNNKNQGGIVVKASYMDYLITKLYDGYYTSVKTGKYYKCSTIEPTIYYRHMFGDVLIFTTYLGKYGFNSNIPTGKFSDIPSLIGFGFGFILDKNLFKPAKPLK